MTHCETWSPLPDDFPVADPFPAAEFAVCTGCAAVTPRDDMATPDCGHDGDLCPDCVFAHLTSCATCAREARDSEDL